MTSVAAWPVVVPLAGGSLMLLAGRRGRPAAGLAAAGATLAAAGGAAQALWLEGPFRHAVGGWEAPLGIALRVDGFGAAMLLMTGIVGFLISVYAALYFSDAAGLKTGAPGAAGAAAWGAGDGFWPLWLFLWAALNAVFLSADVFNLYVALELLTLGGIGLIVLAGDRAALSAAMRYLLAAFLGSLTYLLGVALLYGSADTLDLTLLGARLEPGPANATALALMTSGLLLKTAVFPLHFWLPRAHAAAVTPASAILSGLVVKASFYIAIRLWVEAFPAVAAPAAAQLVGALGAAAVGWGALQAVRQHRLKLLIAYSTVSQIGYLFMMVPLVMPGEGSGAWRADAWAGGIYHALTHGFAKAAMFLAAGAMAQAAGGDRVEQLTGLAHRLPLAVFAFGLAGLTVIGLPPSGGFVAKWLLLSAAVGSGQWWWAVVLLAGGVLSAAYVFLVLGHTLMPAHTLPGAGLPGARRLELVSLLLALGSLLLGLRAAEPLLLIGRGTSW